MTTTSLFSASSPSRTRRVEMEDPDMDCPSPTCEGWLRFFANESSVKDAVFVSCSNDFEGDGRCFQKVMFSKFDTICPACKKPIQKKEVITCLATGGKWVHMKCFCEIGNNEEVLFAICQKCRKSIRQESDAISSVCGGRSGYRHLKCPNKRKLLDESGEEFDQDPSQDSSSLITPPKNKAKK